MAIIPNLRRSTGYENQNLAVDSNHLLGWEWYTPRAHLAMMGFDLVVTSTGEMGPDQFHSFAIQTWWLPLNNNMGIWYGDHNDIDAYAKIVIPASIKLTRAGVTRADLEGYADSKESGLAAVGGLSLFWRPDGMKFTKLVNVDMMECRLLHEQHFRLGWHQGTAYRTGTAVAGEAGFRTSLHTQFGIASGIDELPIPGLIVHYLVNPEESVIADDTWERGDDQYLADTGSAAITEFNDLDFLAPERQIFDGKVVSFDANVMDRVTGWMYGYTVEGNGDQRLWKNQALNVVWHQESLWLTRVHDLTPTTIGIEVGVSGR